MSGQWVDGGQIYLDDLRQYTVAVGGMIATAAELTAMVAFAKGHYAQLAVYVRYLGASEIL